MPAWMHIDNDSTDDRYAAALSFITKGRAVAFPGFSLALCDDILRVDVDYPGTEPDDKMAAKVTSRALEDFENLLDANPDFRASLLNCPRRIALIWSNGKGEVEIAKVNAGEIVWRVEGT